MKKTLSILAFLTIGLLSTSSSFADTIKCNFTEPFVNTTYSMAQQTLTVVSPEIKKQIIKNVSFQIKGPAKFNLVDKNGNTLQELNLNQNGSDGMSDNVYPYEVKASYGIGGCSSNYLKIKTTALYYK